MINIIIVEDEEHWMAKYKFIVNEIRKNKKIDFKFKFFNFYSDELKKYIKEEKEGNTFYLIDIVLKSKNKESESGLDLISDIRDIDKNSLIVLISGEPYLISEAQRKRLNIFSYIYKDDKPLDHLKQDLSDALEMFGLLKGLSFKSDGIYYNLKYKDVNYIKTESDERKCYIKTIKNEFCTRTTLKAIETQLPNYFIKINRDILINTNNIKKLDLNNEIIKFHNGDVLQEAIPPARRKGVRSLCGMRS